MNTRRLLLSPLCLLIALISIIGLNVSSASAGSAAETRVRAIPTVAEINVGQPSGERPASVGCVRPSQPETVVGSCVATEAVPPIKPGSAGGPTAGKPFPQSVKDAALAENPSTCVYCHMETPTPQVDHAIPKVQGGNATIENAQTTCSWCNPSKGGRDFPVNPPPGYVGPWPPPWWSTSP